MRMQGAMVAMAVLAVMAGSGCATLPVAEAPERDRPGVAVIAHRGASAYAPENTLAAFRLAHEMGADWFELDCTLTKDGQVIVIHDDTTDRTTGVPGAVAEMTLAELKELEAGAWKDERFRGEPLPTLGESLDFAKGRIGVYVEIKNADDDTALVGDLWRIAAGEPLMTPALAGRVMAAIEASGTRNLALTRACIAAIRGRDMEDEAVIQSFSPVVCAVALIEAPDIRTEYLGSYGAAENDKMAQWEMWLRWGHFIRAQGFNVSNKTLTEGRLAAFMRAGVSTAVWTVNDPADMRRLADWGVDAIITDRPDLCLEVLAEMGVREGVVVAAR